MTRQFIGKAKTPAESAPATEQVPANSTEEGAQTLTTQKQEPVGKNLGPLDPKAVQPGVLSGAAGAAELYAGITGSLFSVEKLVDSRADRYGSFKDRGLMVDAFTSVARSHPNWEEKLLPQHRHALNMIFEKIGRILVGNEPEYKDNWEDIAGYATLIVKDQ